VLGDRLWASHKSQPHKVMAVQEPANDQQVATAQPKKKAFKKKSSGGGSSGNRDVLSHAEPMLDPACASCTSVMELPPEVAPSPAADRETKAPGAALAFSNFGFGTCFFIQC
jgi:hypothetical protein